MKNLIREFKNKRILVIGDLMLDQYDDCKQTRRTEDEGACIYDVKKRRVSLGGAANVALNLESLGAKVILTGVVGVDAEANIFMNLIKKSKISEKNIIIDPDRPTTTKIRIVINSNLEFRVDRETTLQIKQTISEKIKKIIVSNIEKVDGCIISDYSKGVVTKEISQFAILNFKKLGKPIFIDPKGNDYEKYKCATMITPNTKELSQVSGIELHHKTNEIETVAEKLRKKLELEFLVVTVGSKGMIMMSKGETISSPAFKVKKVNASGAGDTAISVIALGFIAGLKKTKILELANYCCSQVIQKKETVPVRM